MVRNIKGTDIPRLIELWNVALPDHAMNRDAFVKNILLDMNFDDKGFFVYERDGELLGFAEALVRVYPVDVGAPAGDEWGYLNVIGFKNEEYAAGEIGDDLLAAVEKYVISCGKSEIRVGTYSPNYVYPGISVRHPDISALLCRHSYVEHKRNNSIGINLMELGVIEEIENLKKIRENEGYVFDELREEYLISLLKSDFIAPGWTHRHRRLINETMDFGKVRLVMHGGEVVGCAVFGDPYSSDERFGPYGVNAKYRGLGLGKILLYDTLWAMKKRGLRHAWAQSTPVEGAAAEIYRKFGFAITDSFISYSKKLPQKD